MAVAFSSIRARVRAKLNDMDARRPWMGVVSLDQAIIDNFTIISSRLPGTKVYSASGLTISAGADTFALPTSSSAEYAGEVKLRLVSSGQFLDRISVDEMEAIRNGNPTTYLGVPYCFALWEESDQEVQGRCFPGAQVAEACDLFVSKVASSLRTSDIDTASVTLSETGQVALILQTACEQLLAMPEEELKTRNLNPRVGEKWAKEAEMMIVREMIRRRQLEDTGRTQRWVS